MRLPPEIMLEIASHLKMAGCKGLKTYIKLRGTNQRLRDLLVSPTYQELHHYESTFIYKGFFLCYICHRVLAGDHYYAHVKPEGYLVSTRERKRHYCSDCALEKYDRVPSPMYLCA